MSINYLENNSHPSKGVPAAAASITAVHKMHLKHKFPCLYMPVLHHIDIV